MLRWIGNGYRTGFPQAGRKPIKSPRDRGKVPLVIQSLWSFKMPSSQRARASECRRRARAIWCRKRACCTHFPQLPMETHVFSSSSIYCFFQGQTHSLCPYHKCLLGLLKFYPVVDNVKSLCLTDHVTFGHLIRTRYLYCDIFFSKICNWFIPNLQENAVKSANDSVISVAPSKAVSVMVHEPFIVLLSLCLIFPSSVPAALCASVYLFHPLISNGLLG